MIVLSSAYKGGGRTDLSCNIEEAADHYTALQCAVTNHIGLWYLNLLQKIKMIVLSSAYKGGRTDLSCIIQKQLITALFKTNQTKSSLMALGIVCGLMDLFSDEIQAMPPPPKGDSKPARSRRGSTVATDDDEVESLIADFTPVGDVDRPVQQEDIEPISPLPGTIEGERKKNEEQGYDYVLLVK